MPTCSQAKILTNLEGDINKRFFKFSNASEASVKQNNNINHTNQFLPQMNQNHHQPQLINYDYDFDTSNQEVEVTRISCLKQDSTSSYNKSHLYQPKSANQNRYCNKFLRNFSMAEQRRLGSKRNSFDESSASNNEYIQYSMANTVSNPQYNYAAVQTTSNPNQQPILHKIPIIFGDLNPKRDSVPINFLYNSPLRTNHRYSINQLKINSLRTSLKMNVGSDGEEVEDVSSNGGGSNSSGSNSFRNTATQQPINKTNQAVQTTGYDKSYISLPEVRNFNYYLSRRRSSTNSIASGGASGGYQTNGMRRKSWDSNQCLPVRSKKNSIEDIKLYGSQTGICVEYMHVNFNQAARRDSLRKYGSTHFGHQHFGSFSKLRASIPESTPPTDVESMTVNNAVIYPNPTAANRTGSLNKTQNDAQNNSDQNIDLKVTELGRKLSLEQAKRLLAIASIRPSKTFHKSMSEEEMEILKKYYDLIKPKASANLSNQGQNEASEPFVYYPPITYQSAKVSLTSLKNLKTFIDTYKKEIDSGRYKIDYDMVNDPKGFVLKDQSDQSVIKFPEEINDSFFALAITNGDKDNKTMSEANLYRIVNWNDTKASCFKTPAAKIKKAAKSSFLAKQQQQQQQAREEELIFKENHEIESSKGSPGESFKKDLEEMSEQSSKSSPRRQAKVDFDLAVETASSVDNGSHNDEEHQSQQQQEGSTINSDTFRTSSIMVNMTAKKSSAQHHKKKKHITSSSTQSASSLPSVHLTGKDTNSNNTNVNETPSDANVASIVTDVPNESDSNDQFDIMPPPNNFRIKYSNSYTITPNSGSPNSSTLSFDYIKSLSSLVNSIIEPKLLKQLTNSGVDISLLPGGANYEIPSFEELGINIKSIMKSENSTTTNVDSAISGINGLATSFGGSESTANATLIPGMEIHNPKLRNTVYKRLREKVDKAKVMWFAAPPMRKPMSVIFEYAGVDISHATILEEVNNYIKVIGGNVEGLEFVPRSVHVNSVKVDNLWILTLNDMNTKFYTITNGIVIQKHKIAVKSYDDFIFSEYEKFIRNEKYKQLIKNHEKAVEKSKKKSIN